MIEGENKMEIKFYRCEVCGQIIAIVKKTGVPLVCCGKPMKEIIPGTVDASHEKHLPVIEQNGNIVTVKVGSVAHPMLEEHHIEWIALQTKTGNQRKMLKAGDKPEVCFALCEGDAPVAALEWCNLHGLWKTEAK